MTKTLRDYIQKYSSDPQQVIAALYNAGVKCSKEECYQIVQGQYDQYSDKQLVSRFNAKVCGYLGIPENVYQEYYNKYYKE